MSLRFHAHDLEDTIQSLAARLECGIPWQTALRSLRVNSDPSVHVHVTHELLFRLASRRLDAGDDWKRVSGWVNQLEVPDNADRILQRLQEPTPGLHLAGGWLFLMPVRRGLYADVWKVEKTSGGGRSHAAVKLLRPHPMSLPHDRTTTRHWDEHEARRRFALEAKLHACLSNCSPFLCRHIATNEWRRTPYILTEWVAGESLGVYCLTRRLTPRQRLQLFIRILRGVEALHAHSVAHRDLKPCNILVTTDTAGEPCPRIIDLGAAMPFDDLSATRLASEGMADRWLDRAGCYRTPEQISGSSASEWYKECDVYRLGVVLHEILYGFRPWQWFEPLAESTSHELGRALGIPQADWNIRNSHLRQTPPAPFSHRDRENGLTNADCETLAHARSVGLQQYELLLKHSDLWTVVLSAICVDPSQRPSIGALRAQLELLVPGSLLDSRSEASSTQLNTTSGTAPCLHPRSAQIHPTTRVAVLIATRNRPQLLRERALASVAVQTLTPSIVVVVNDGVAWTPDDVEDIRGRLGGSELLCLSNCRRSGVGGAWNTGLSRLLALRHQGFVAILDDDDLWDADHLQINHDAASDTSANIVVSGLRLRSPLGDLPRPFVARLNDRDFLAGNPGWQGSNTFVHIDLFAAVGGFRESLRSMHDRDLAIRLLRHRDAKPWLVPKWTSTWCMDLPGRLSDRRGTAKLEGLRTFWALYSAEMTCSEQRAFFDRADMLFGFQPSDIVTQHSQSGACSVPPTGDLIA